MNTFFRERKFNTDVCNRSFEYKVRILVWNKATVVPGRDPNELRKDACGAWIKWSQYGNTDSQYGWEIDHIYPASLGGSDLLFNLQPLQWANNRKKGDSTGVDYCTISAAG